MMTQSNLYNFSPEFLAANFGSYAVAASQSIDPTHHPVTSLYEYHQHSPTILTPPYEYNFVPVYKAPKFFDEFNKYGHVLLSSSSTPSSPNHQAFSMQLPLTPPLSTSPPVASVTPPTSVFRSALAMPIAKSSAVAVAVAAAEIVDATAVAQRTRSVIMKVEDQRIVEISPKDLNGRCSSESEDEIIVCKWRDCYRQFESLEQLAAHVTAAHAVASNAGLYYCMWESCARSERGFNARYKMLVHVRTHTKEKPHHCTECSKSFSRAENLKIHIRSHSGEKPYVCPVDGCNKAYSNSSDRFKHTRTHSTEKPYVCKFPSCSKRYTDPSSLRKHVKTFKHIEQINANGVMKTTSSPTSPSSSWSSTLNDGGNDKTKKTENELARNGGGAMIVSAWPSQRSDSMYKLEQLFNNGAHIDASKIDYRGVNDDEHIDSVNGGFWIERNARTVVADNDSMDIDLPLDLSLRKIAS